MTTGGVPLAAIERSPMAATSWATNHLAAPPATDHDQLAVWAATTSYAAQLAAGIVCGDVDAVLADGDAVRWLQACNADVIVGGPPCKGFSTNGLRDPSDPRNLLVWSFLRVVQHVAPKMVVLENVVGMTRPLAGQSRSTFAAVADELAALGYRVQPCLVDAVQYDTPQRRKRVLVIGVRGDLVADGPGVEPLWESVPSLLAVPPLAPVPSDSAPLSVRDALTDLCPDTGDYLPDFGTDRGSVWRATRRGTHGAMPANSTVPTHTPAVTQRMRLHLLLRDLGLGGVLPDAAVRDDRTLLKPLADVSDVPAGICEPGETLTDAAWRLRTRKRTQVALELDRPSPTVCTLPDDLVHPTRPRRLTVRESARLQGFDDTFVFAGRDITGGLRRRVDTPTYSQIGNAVPPPLGAAIGRVIASVLARQGAELAC
jgi:DNA (cytosine-5)-methyltransferase 1